MNAVMIIGRLTKDPQMNDNGTMARFSVAIDRGKDRNGEDQGADYPNIKCFGKTAELVQKYLSKGRMVGITGRLQTGSYKNKDGATVYTTDVIADRVEFLDRGEKSKEADPVADGFSKIGFEEVPF